MHIIIVVTQILLSHVLTPIFSESGVQLFPDKSNPMLRLLVVLFRTTLIGVNAKAEDAIQTAIVAVDSFMVLSLYNDLDTKIKFNKVDHLLFCCCFDENLENLETVE